MTQENMILKLLSNGLSVTPAKLRTLGIASPSKVVSRLRRKGNCIYTKSTGNGTTYRLGTPSAQMIAMAFLVAGPRAYM